MRKSNKTKTRPIRYSPTDLVSPKYYSGAHARYSMHFDDEWYEKTREREVMRHNFVITGSANDYLDTRTVVKLHNGALRGNELLRAKRKAAKAAGMRRREDSELRIAMEKLRWVSEHCGR